MATNRQVMQALFPAWGHGGELCVQAVGGVHRAAAWLDAPLGSGSGRDLLLLLGMALFAIRATDPDAQGAADSDIPFAASFVNRLL